jgi:hypothetical protein
VESIQKALELLAKQPIAEENIWVCELIGKAEEEISNIPDCGFCDYKIKMEGYES